GRARAGGGRRGRGRGPAGAVGAAPGPCGGARRPGGGLGFLRGVVPAAAEIAARRWKKMSIVVPAVTTVAAVTAYAAHTGATAILVLLPLGGALAIAGLIPGKTRLPAVALIARFGVYTRIAPLPMLWRGVPLTSLPFALARATVVVALVGGAATCVLYVLTSSAARSPE